MKIRMLCVAVAAALLLGAAALGEGYRVDKRNYENFGHLLIDLLHAYETPSPEDQRTIAATLDRIWAVNGWDYQVGKAIADHWNAVYVNPDGAYQPCLYDGGERATALERYPIPDGPTHAFVVLGFELKDGEMTDELVGRCDAAAAAARSFPGALLVCSGGATGKNNPHRHTEAGLMKDYLVNTGGIDADRILTDERASNTLENASNTFKLLRESGVSTITIITSSYHQQRGQALYNAMSALYRLDVGYSVEIVGNYSYEVESAAGGQPEDRLAARQLATMLHLPDRVVESMKKWF